MSQTVQLRQDRRRRIHRILVWIILGTLPFYLCGIITLVGFGGENRQATVTTTESTTPTNEALLTESTTVISPGDPTITLQATPTQYIPPQATAIAATPISPLQPVGTSAPTATPEVTTEVTTTVDATGTFIIEQRQTLDAQHLTEMAATHIPPEQGPGQPSTQGQPMPPGQDRPR